MRKLFVPLACVVVLAACNNQSDSTPVPDHDQPATATDKANHRDEAIKAIQQAEKQFALMAATQGVAKAFAFYEDR